MKSDPSIRCDQVEILRALTFFMEPGQVTELRALNATTTDYRRPHTVSGYFDTPAELAKAAASITDASGIYITLNPIKPALLARAVNRLRTADKGGTTSDSDVTERHWLAVDLDPVRPTGISSTNAEHEAALELALTIRDTLMREGWPQPIFGDSGNGAHLLWRIDHPADDDGMIEIALQALAARFDTAMVKVDRTTFNPARIWKLYGTTARKGDNTTDRPHRLAKLLTVPEKLEAVRSDVLKRMAPTRSATSPKIGSNDRPSAVGMFNLASFMAAHFPEAKSEPYKGGQRWPLSECPFNAEHVGGSACVFEAADGRPGFKCLHNSCVNKDWHALRNHVEPNGHDTRRGGRKATSYTDAGDLLAGPVMTCMADVQPKPIDWLWPERVPLGRITLLVGRPGEGKSFLTTYMAARVTTGTPWPDGSDCPTGSVILISAEDGPGDTIRPRLDAHGADVRKVHLLSASRRVSQHGKRYEVLFTLADVATLESALNAHPDCKLIVVDPIGSFLGGGTDAHRDNEVRSVLAPVARLAEKYGVAVVVVAHRRKSAGSIADDLALGSRAFTGIARAVWHLTREKRNKARRLLLPGKNNLAPEGEGLAFTIIGDPPAIEWESEPVRMNADDALAVENGEQDGKPGPEPVKLNMAKDWLLQRLSAGAAYVGDVKNPLPGTLRADVAEAGLSWSTVRRAFEEMEIKSERCQYTGKYQWRLLNVVAHDASNMEGTSNLSNLQVSEENTSILTPDPGACRSSNLLGNHAGVGLPDAPSPTGAGPAATDGPICTGATAADDNVDEYDRLEREAIQERGI